MNTVCYPWWPACANLRPHHVDTTYIDTTRSTPRRFSQLENFRGVDVVSASCQRRVGVVSASCRRRVSVVSTWCASSLDEGWHLWATIDRLPNSYRAPPYLSEHCISVSSADTRRNLRSANGHLLAVPRFRLNTYDRPAFSVAGQMALNSLPDFIRDPTSSTDCFRRLLTTYTCSPNTSAPSALWVFNDYALYKFTHSLTHSYRRCQLNAMKQLGRVETGDVNWALTTHHRHVIGHSLPGKVE